jgi:hypothetical protein
MTKLFSKKRSEEIGRLLTDEELAHVVGGYGQGDDDDDDDDDIGTVVTGRGTEGDDEDSDPGDDPLDEEEEGDEEDGGEDAVIVVDALKKTKPSECVADSVNIFFNGQSFDGHLGASYYIPDAVDGKRLNEAWNRIVALNNLSVTEGGDIKSKLEAIFSMYQNMNDPYHLDFKDYPANDIEYFSPVTGVNVSESPFAAFGNFWFGAIMTAAGFSMEETSAIAAATQNLPPDATKTQAVLHALSQLANVAVGGQGDDPVDSVHVTLGARAAAAYIAQGLSGMTFVIVTHRTCGG